MCRARVAEAAGSHPAILIRLVYNSCMWTLEKRAGGDWGVLKSDMPSADRCRSLARSDYKTENGVAVGNSYRIISPMGNIYQVSMDNRTWRLNWKYYEGKG